LVLIDPSSSAPTPIPTLDPTTAYRTLGFYIAANGSYHTQLSIIRDIIDKWTTIVSSSHLDNSQRWLAFRTFLYPCITYPLQLAAIPLTQLLKLDQRLAPHVLQSLNLNLHFPRAFSHGPISLGGLALPDCTLYNLSHRTYLLLHFLSLDNDTGHLFNDSIDWSQLQLGTSTHLLNTPSNPIISPRPRSPPFAILSHSFHYPSSHRPQSLHLDVMMPFLWIYLSPIHLPDPIFTH